MNVRTRMAPVGMEITMPRAPVGTKALGHAFQAYPPAEHPWPVDVVEAIRHDIDPEFCPMWCWHVYRRADGGIYKTGRHWIWLEKTFLEAPASRVRYLPASYGVNAGRHPNVLLRPLEKKRTKKQELENIAGDFIEFDWWLYDEMKLRRDTYVEDPDQAFDEYMQAQQRAANDPLVALDKETDYRLEHDREHLQKVRERISDSDLKTGFRQKWENVPFVDLGKKGNA